MRLVFATLGLWLSVVQVGLAADAPRPDVRRVLPAWAETWRTADIDKMMAFYEDSRALVAVESRGVIHKGSAAVKMMYQNAFAELTWEKVGLEEIEVGQEGNVAWATFRWKAEATAKKPPMPLAFDVRGSMVFKWDGRAWRIVQEHFSPIADVPRVKARTQ